MATEKVMITMKMTVVTTERVASFIFILRRIGFEYFRNNFASSRPTSRMMSARTTAGP